jgi:tetratricopeptide (TPR) repeat protein
MGRSAVWVCLLLLAVAVAYAGVGRWDFVNLDDPLYVTANPAVRAGVTVSGVGWAFTTMMASNWHPLTWLSHMLDVQLFGLAPAGHHLTSVVLHLLNVLLVWVVLRRLTGKTWPSLLAAALFGLHPLRVESVAWVGERKDVLSLFFALLGLWAYAAYAERPSAARMALVALCLALGLMAKAMLVTFPFVLLLLDWWPLRRLRPPARRVLGLVAEKLPLFALSAAAVVVGVIASGRDAALGGTEAFPVGLRFQNAVASYVAYLAKTAAPVGLAAFYPYPRSFPWWQTAAGLVLLIGVSIGVVLVRRRRPYLLVGWLWFVGTLVPVIGLVQTGSQAMADRYTLLPHVGLAVAVAWSVWEFAVRSRARTRLATGAAFAVLAVLGFLTARQAEVWRDSRTLFEHALAVTDDNWLAHNNLGDALVREGRLDEAAAHFEESLRLLPENPDAHYNLAIVRARTGRTEEAVAEYRAALRLAPGNVNARNNLGLLLLRTGAVDEAVEELSRVVAVRPDPGARANLALALGKAGRHAEAAEQLRLVLAVMPDFAEGHWLLAESLSALGRPEEAEEHYARARALKPDLASVERR